MSICGEVDEAVGVDDEFSREGGHGDLVRFSFGDLDAEGVELSVSKAMLDAFAAFLKKHA